MNDDVIYQDETVPILSPGKKNDEGSIGWRIAPELPLPSKERLDQLFAGKPRGAREAFENMITKANRAATIVRIGIYKEMLSITRKPVMKGYKMFVCVGNRRLPVKFVGDMYPDISRAIREDNERENEIIHDASSKKNAKEPRDFKLETIGYFYESCFYNGKKHVPVMKVISDAEIHKPLIHLDLGKQYPQMMSWYELQVEPKLELPVHDKFKEKIYECVEVGNVYSNNFDVVGNVVECKSFEYEVLIFDKVHDTITRLADMLLHM